MVKGAVDMKVDSLEEVKVYLDALKEHYHTEQGKRDHILALIKQKERSMKEGLEQ